MGVCRVETGKVLPLSATTEEVIQPLLFEAAGPEILGSVFPGGGHGTGVHSRRRGGSSIVLARDGGLSPSLCASSTGYHHTAESVIVEC